MHFQRKRSGEDRQRLGHATRRRSLRKGRKKGLEDQIKEATRV